MKTKVSKKKQKGIAERKTEIKRRKDIPYKAIGMGIVLWLLVTWLFFGRGIVPRVSYEEGDSISSSVEALVDFECEDLHATELAREQMARDVARIFRMDPNPRKRAAQKIQVVFDRLTEVVTSPEEDRIPRIASINDLLLGSDIDGATFAQAFPADSITSIRDSVLKGIDKVMTTGIMSDEARDLFDGEKPDCPLSIRMGDTAPPKKEVFKNIYSRRQAVWTITEHAGNEMQRDLLDKLLFSEIEDNLNYDADATQEMRDTAAAAVPPVTKKYVEGDTLVRSGDRADEQSILLLQKHNQKVQENRDATEQAAEIIGNGILLLLGLVATTVMVRIGDNMLIRKIDKLLLMMILSLLTLGTVRLLTFLSFQQGIIPQSLIPYLAPHALAVLLAGILLGGNAAISLGFWTSFATAVLLDHSFSAFALGMLVTVTATSTARNVHRRASLFRAGLWVCAVMILYVLATAMMKHLTLSSMAGQLAAAIISGVLSTVLTLLLIPVFEKLFKITTDITLLELSDMGHPLLQKMAMQAPGTYHHSLMVATLAQNAAEAIGANSLLVRVCAYYHDIGKMAKPEFFTENIQHKENPHDDLSPHMSALVISSHVKEGLTLAKRHKLPQPILDAIEQHHGNGLISFFYHKAKMQAGDGTTTMADMINDSDFRYGGAPAVTPEMAILSLADASEAASRSIEKPTPQKISNMLDDIFAAKIRDGQMDYANLTMAEIKVVKQSFVFSLSNMLHGRIPYPKNNENKHSKPAEKTSRKNSGTAKAE